MGIPTWPATHDHGGHPTRKSRYGAQPYLASAVWVLCEYSASTVRVRGAVRVLCEYSALPLVPVVLIRGPGHGLRLAAQPGTRR